MILPKSSCVCIPCFKFVISRGVVLDKVLIFWFLFLFCFFVFLEGGVARHKHRNRCDHIQVLQNFQDYIDYKYIWVHGSHSLGSSIFAQIPFLAFLAIHR